MNVSCRLAMALKDIATGIGVVGVNMMALQSDVNAGQFNISGRAAPPEAITDHKADFAMVFVKHRWHAVQVQQQRTTMFGPYLLKQMRHHQMIGLVVLLDSVDDMPMLPFFTP